MNKLREQILHSLFIKKRNNSKIIQSLSQQGDLVLDGRLDAASSGMQSLHIGIGIEAIAHSPCKVDQAEP